jgi:hypothetical protein
MAGNGVLRSGDAAHHGAEHRVPCLALPCLAVAQALLGHRYEARRLRFARKHLTGVLSSPLNSRAATSGCERLCPWSTQRQCRAGCPVRRPTVRTALGGPGTATAPVPLSGLLPDRHAHCVGAGQTEDRPTRSPGLDAGDERRTGGQIRGLTSDKGFAGKVFEQDLAGRGIELMRPSRRR